MVLTISLQLCNIHFYFVGYTQKELAKEPPNNFYVLLVFYAITAIKINHECKNSPTTLTNQSHYCILSAQITAKWLCSILPAIMSSLIPFISITWITILTIIVPAAGRGIWIPITLPSRWTTLSSRPTSTTP